MCSSSLHVSPYLPCWYKLLTSNRLTKEPRSYLSGRYLSVHWDTDELEAKKDEILKGDKLKFKMAI